jgi:ketosteroid isomerase-like protein
LATADVITKYYETVNAGDWNSWLELFDENVVIDEQLAGHVEGLDVLRGAVGAMEKGYSKFQMIPEHTVIEGDEACVIWHCVAANAAGDPIDAKGANYFRMENDHIVYMSNFHDTVAFAPFVNQKLD